MHRYSTLIYIAACFMFSINAKAQITLNTTNGSTRSDSYLPIIEKTLKARKVKICADSLIVTPREILSGPCKDIIGTRIVYDTIRKVDTNVDEVPGYKGGIKKLNTDLNANLKFTQKDVRNKTISVYKIYLLIDEKGKVAGVEYVSGKKEDNFYTRLIEQIFKLDNWSPAILVKDPVPYKMPLVLNLKPTTEGRYTIDIAKTLTVETVFEDIFIP